MQVWFFFLITIIDGAFHVVTGFGNVAHNNHSKTQTGDVLIPPRLLSPANTVLLNQVHAGDASNGVIRNLLVFNSGTLLSLNAIRYHTGLKKLTSDWCCEGRGSPDGWFLTRQTLRSYSIVS